MRSDSLHVRSPEQLSRLRELARKIRIHAIRMTQRAKSSHVASSMSMAEILAVFIAGFCGCGRSRSTPPTAIG